MSTRRCSVIYLVPYIHSDNSRRGRSRGRAAAVLYEEQRSGTPSIFCPQDASLHPQGGARVITKLLIIAALKYIINFFFQFIIFTKFRLFHSILGILVATTMAVMPTSILTPSRASTRVWPTSQRSQARCTTPPTTARLHRSGSDARGWGLVADQIHSNWFIQVLY